MIFTWFGENRGFKKGSGISGQIAPFLIVVMVILIIAAIATINIGRVAIDKTYSANAADAGALSAATAYASGFNALSQSNYDQLFLLYEANRTLFEDTKDDADGFVDAAIAYMTTAVGIGAAAYTYLQCSVPICIFPYTYMYAWVYCAFSFALAGAACQLANMEVAKFITMCNYLRGIVDAHKRDGNSFYSSICTAMQTSQTSSTDTGKSYAFSNSGISSKLSVQQAKDYNDWMTAEGYTSGVYSWQDKPTVERPSQTHKVTVDASVPGISSYDIQKTNYTYTKECEIIDEMISTANTISDIIGGVILALGIVVIALYTLASTSTLGQTAYTTYLSCLAACSGPWWAICAAGCLVYYLIVSIPLCINEWYWYGWATGYTASIVAIIAALLVAGSGITFYGLKEKADDALYGFMMDGTYSSSGCSDTDDILIVKIDSANPSGWETEVCSQQEHPGTSQGLLPTSYQKANSCARATFDKNGLGGSGVASPTQDYDSQLTSAN
jgi:hypothetical protein